MNKEEIWQAALGNLGVILSEANFSTWFKDTFIIEMGENTVLVGVPSGFAKEWLEDKYLKEIKESLAKITEKEREVIFKITSIKPPSLIKETKDNEKTAVADLESETVKTLNQRYTFNNFVVGNSNRLAFAAAQAVAEKPGQAHNPLFIYGGVGLGKTHLAQAIGHKIHLFLPKLKILYVSAELFTNEFVQSISQGKMNEFKKNYRDIDVLLVDDIQFLSQKEGTQQEFFHTFNTLHQKNRQIVMTADRLPKAIPALEERLSSRFGMGMVADIQPPNLEMRVAILRNKCEELDKVIPEEVLDFVAQNVQKNIRDLEGALTRLIAHCELNQQDFSVEVAKGALENILTTTVTKNLSVEKVIKMVCQFFNLPEKDALNTRRHKEIVYPRQIIMYLLREELGLSYPSIGRVLGGKDHTTIMHGCHKIEKEKNKNEKTASEITSLKEQLYQSF
ncbi:chromosomal replication initiator protein DnaA [Candidatus Berkelbacteria bacterium]|nr:chromosomal replication initiator protein DnaA [Candidatus Berkelbacteria bacterium]